MKNLALTSLCLAWLVALPLVSSAQNQKNDTDFAVDESVRREALKKDLGYRLAEAQAAEKRGALPEAARLYTECLDLIRTIGSGVDAEHRVAVEGNTAVRIILADQARRAGDYAAADLHYATILRDDPKNERVIELQRINAADRAAQKPFQPSEAQIAKLPEYYTNRVEAAT
ncbi:MAG TPA: hypothetical protein VJS65_09245, partial [Verrucomicrobiae bacterium]|nr:hypothetical protein [Verrucomicrobiae bacterium]